MHSWLHTGMRWIHLQKEAQSTCPRCGKIGEDQAYFLKCFDSRAFRVRYNAFVKLSSTVYVQKGSSRTWSSMVLGLQTWIAKDHVQPSIIPPVVKGELREVIVADIGEQNNIGWLSFSRCFVSKTWVAALHLEKGKMSSAQGRKWNKLVQTSLWDFPSTLWKHRNEIWHSNSPGSKDIKESLVNARIIQLYEAKETFPATDCMLFDMPVQQRVSTTLCVRKHWLALMEQFTKTATKQLIVSQSVLTQFLKEQHGHPVIHSVRGWGANDRMHSSFPAHGCKAGQDAERTGMMYGRELDQMDPSLANLSCLAGYATLY